MIRVRKSKDRGHANFGWLDSRHTFSFGDYYDPKIMGFRVLRVINEDFIEGSQGFGTHGHQNMEIITIVINGALEHKDTLGTTAMIRPGEVQRMSAGTGVKHSEYSKESEGHRTHLLQIWLLPDKDGYPPSYEQKSFEEEFKSNKLTLVVSKNGERGSLKMNQDAKIFMGHLKKGDSVSAELSENRHAWVQLVSGEIELNGETLLAGDGAGLSSEKSLQFKAASDAQFIYFDLP